MDCTFHRKRFPTESITRPVDEFYENKKTGGYYKVCKRCRKRVKHLKGFRAKTRRDSTDNEVYLHFLVDEEISDAVKRVAQLKGCTMAYYLQEMIRENVYQDILELVQSDAA